MTRDPAEFRRQDLIEALHAEIRSLASLVARLKCSVPGCERPKVKLGYCDMHYRRVAKTGRPGDPQPLVYGRRNPSWKGEGAGYSSLHEWIKRRLPRPTACDGCRQEKELDLANVSQQYRRDLSDWEWLCRRCHMAKDGRAQKLASYSRKLDAEKAQAIRSERRTGASYGQLAAKYGVSKPTIASVIKHETYAA